MKRKLKFGGKLPSFCEHDLISYFVLKALWELNYFWRQHAKQTTIVIVFLSNFINHFSKNE